MKIAVLDDFQDCVKSLACFAKIQKHDVLVLNRHVSDPVELSGLLKGVQALVLIRERTYVGEALLSRLPDLKVIAQTGKIGRHLDMAACQARGIAVFETEGTAVATAEFTLLMILASLRNLVSEVTNMNAGIWQRTLGRQLHGRTLGILGLGRIGEQVAQSGQTLGARILVWGREGSQQKARERGWAVASSREAFFAQSDVLCILVRLSPQTQGLVTAHDLALMKTDAILINTARAELIEPDALVTALRLGRPGFAAVDVYEQEPVMANRHPLQDLPNCLCSPHLGFVERDNYENYLGQAFDHINRFCDNATR
ncbi:MAG: D-2-hydroxyacid dehydrogenase family protein [Betaproteobacteria bacterium]|jgi:D-3-phosphoglycerate dehydrogenase|nr:D-2-hydroxyacid dehydrogenase family protein [Betaproteobacteria bacterium]